MGNSTKNTLLIVDDTPENLDVLNGILKDEYRIKVATNGHTALKIVSLSEPPDLILLDIMMPGMDGYELCTRLKSQENTSEIPIIFITAKNDVEDEAKGLELGAVDYITKPVNPEIVRARVKNHLELKFARQTLERQYKELLEAAKLRDEVEQIMRHDLKGPLVSIIGMPDIIMRENNLSERQKKLLKHIGNAGYDMLEMINRSLDLLKMERKAYKFIPVPVDILDTIKKILAEMQPSIQSKNISIEIDCPHETLQMRGDKLLCYSMMANLIKNAIEASPEEVPLCIECSKKEKTAIISVCNFGEVPLEIRDKFFEKYTSCGKFEGTGLGTYSAKLMANTQGGDIELNTSEKNKTTIIVYMPAVEFPAKIPSELES